jgi:uncharacterized protein YjbI with pentapeptide repeats
LLSFGGHKSSLSRFLKSVNRRLFEMTNSELTRMLESHAAWVRGESGGERANLCGTNLCHADLRGADLAGADLRGADLCRADLRNADLAGADLRYANLRGANLRRANLRRANLRGANLDFSAWPLWCGTSNVQLDKRQQAQLLAHAFQVAVDFPLSAEMRDLILANFHHRDFFTREADK